MNSAQQILELAWQDAWATVHAILVLGLFAGCFFALGLIIKEYL